MRRIPAERYIQFGRYLRVNYSRSATLSALEQEAVDKQDPSIHAILHKLRNQPQDRLRWNFIPNTSRSFLPLAVMRNRLKRRWNEAFRQALQQHGYEHDGKRPAFLPGKARPMGLSGSLQILLLDAGGWEQPMDWLVKLSNDLVRALKAGKFEKR